MNKMVLYSKCVTIRDKQIEEKKQITESYKIQEKRKDLMIEIERLKQIKYYEELERQKKDELRKGHNIIVDQIKEREFERLKKEEERDREGYVAIKQLKEMQKEDASTGIVIIYSTVV